MIRILNRGVKSRYEGSFSVSASNVQKADIMYNGVVAVDPKSPNLPGNIAWMDATGLYHPGVNLGATFQYIGAGTCVIDGSMTDKRYAEQVKTAAGAYLVSAQASAWVPIHAGLGPGVSLTGLFGVWDLLRFTFSAGNPGTVIVASL